MPAVKAAKPNEIFGREDWKRLTTVSSWRGLWLIAHGWAVVLIAAGGAAWAWQWHWLAGLAATPLALAIIGGRQLGLAILMHEAAHGLSHPDRKLNNFAGDWLSGSAVGSDLQSYRAYHLTHHRFTQQAEDPDLPLSAPFPTSRASLRRKFLRDLTGQTFFKQRKAQIGLALIGLSAWLTGERGGKPGKRDAAAGTPFNKQQPKSGALGGISAPVDAMDRDMTGPIAVAATLGRFLVVQAVLILLSLASGLGMLPYLIWLAALATTFQLFLRVRNIAEHACTTTGGDDPFTHARTTYAGWTARATVAPYWVNFHSEHHLFMGVPCYNLAEAHRLLLAGGHDARMTIAPDYRSVLRLVTATA
ncbi:MAG: fatty acid desaturase [Blastomonas sp.]